jgi:sugar O-acyltransferase (sialic acid O-acetyltransferase NeuD family)
MAEKIIVFGAGGHAKVVIDAIQRESRYEIVAVADAHMGKQGSIFCGYEVKSEAELLDADGSPLFGAIIAIGSNSVRRNLAETILSKGWALVSIVHPAAVVATSASIGAGTLVMPGSVLNADARIGDNTIINTGAIIEHDCEIGEHVHIGPNAILCGGVVIGPGALVGAGAIVLGGVRIDAGATIGAGAVVLRDIPHGATAVGSPARVLERKS